MVRTAQAGGFNTLLVQVAGPRRGRLCPQRDRAASRGARRAASRLRSAGRHDRGRPPRGPPGSRVDQCRSGGGERDAAPLPRSHRVSSSGVADGAARSRGDRAPDRRALAGVSRPVDALDPGGRRPRGGTVSLADSARRAGVHRRRRSRAGVALSTRWRSSRLRAISRTTGSTTARSRSRSFAANRLAATSVADRQRLDQRVANDPFIWTKTFPQELGLIPPGSPDGAL